MTNSADELFVWGDDFETILDILEEDDELEQQFTSTVSEVSLICANLGFVTPFLYSRKQTSLFEREDEVPY